MKKNGKQIVQKESFEIGTPRTDTLIEDILNDFQDGVDFQILVKGKKPTLLVPGADKICMRFALRPEWRKDDDVLSMIDGQKNVIALRCVLIDRKADVVVGEGRGCAQIGESKNCSNANSTVKMAEIRAKRDAVLNLFPIRDRFTQDSEEIAESNGTKMSIDSSGEVTV